MDISPQGVMRARRSSVPSPMIRSIISASEGRASPPFSGHSTTNAPRDRFSSKHKSRTSSVDGMRYRSQWNTVGQPGYSATMMKVGLRADTAHCAPRAMPLARAVLPAPISPRSKIVSPTLTTSPMISPSLSVSRGEFDLYVNIAQTTYHRQLTNGPTLCSPEMRPLLLLSARSI